MIYNISMKNIILNKSPKIIEAVDIIKNTNFNDIDDGRLEYNNGIWANLQTYYTKKDALFEAHRKYIDIQFIIAGHEKIGVCKYETCTTNIPYDNEKDIEFLNANKFEYIEMNTGDFLILYPEDAHKPSISTGNKPTHVRKLVIKVPV